MSSKYKFFGYEYRIIINQTRVVVYLSSVIKRAPLLKVKYDQSQLIKTIRRLRKPIKK